VKIYYRNRWKALMTDGMTRQDVRQCRAIYLHYTVSPAPPERFAEQAAAIKAT